jgi:IS1 family transposase
MDKAWSESGHEKGRSYAKLHFGDRDLGESRHLITRFPKSRVMKRLLDKRLVTTGGHMKEGASPAKLHFGDRDMGESRCLITRFLKCEIMKSLSV